VSIGTKTLAVYFDKHQTGNELIAPFVTAAEADLVTDYDAERHQLMAYIRGTKTFAIVTLQDVEKHLNKAWLSNAEWARTLRTSMPVEEQAEIDFPMLAEAILVCMADQLGALTE